MGRFEALEEMQAETQRNHSTTEAESELTPTAGQRPLSGLSHGIEVLLTTKEASQVLKIHPKVLERMAKRGEVPALKVGKFWRYRATTLDAWISSRLKSDRQPCRMKTSF
jgi:excisionase family DNA binding protein